MERDSEPHAQTTLADASIGPAPLIDASASGSRRDGGAADASTQDASARLPIGEVLGILWALNDDEIAISRLAATRAVTIGVLTFSEQMIAAHTAASTRQVTLGRAQGITPSDGRISEDLRMQTSATVERLSGLAKEAFDLAYMDAQVTLHAGALRIVDEVLFPSAADDRVMLGELTAVREEIVLHLGNAQKLRASLEASSLSPDGGT